MKACLTILAIIFAAYLCGCTNEIRLSDYVSEYRKNIYLGEAEGVSLCAFLSEKEQPYIADGIKANMNELIEIRLEVEDKTLNYEVYFNTVTGEKKGGEMSFDTVHKRFNIMLTVTQNELDRASIDFELRAGEDCFNIRASSAVKENTLSLDKLLPIISKQRQDYFDKLCSDNRFLGEIYVRVLEEDGDNYFYIGIIGKDKSHLAILADGENGEIVSQKTVA